MPVSVYIPSPFRRITANRENVSVEGETVGEVLDAVEALYPGFANLVYGEGHEIPRHINVYLNNTEIHELDGTGTRVSDGDQIAVIPALAGGSEIPALAGGWGNE
jgi:molybdopterin synthase sulfur carrier subunit